MLRRTRMTRRLLFALLIAAAVCPEGVAQASPPLVCVIEPIYVGAAGHQVVTTPRIGLPC